MFHIRRRWLLTALVALALVALSGAIGIADHESGDILLVLDDTTQAFKYDGASQAIETGKAECRVTDSSKSGPIMTMSSSTYNNAGNPVEGHIGLVEDGLGVNLRGNGNGQECGRVDYLGDGLTETLTLELGDAIAGRMMNGVTFDVEAKFDAVVRIDFLRNGASVGHHTEIIVNGSDSGPDSKFRDKYRFTADLGGTLFDGIAISMDSGGIALEGGATWEHSEDPEDAPHLRRTVFHLVDAQPSITISSMTDQANDGIIATGVTVEWTYTVTNNGDLPLTNVVVTEPGFGTVGCGTMSLGLGESTTCTLSDTALAGEQTRSGSVTADSTAGPTNASTDSSYFGSSPGIDIDVTTNGFVDGSGTNYIEVGADVTWTYRVINTGNIDLDSVIVSDVPLGTISGPLSGDDGDGVLQPGESWVYTASGGAVEGSYANTGSVNAIDPIGASVDSSDGSSYFGTITSISIAATNTNGPLVNTGDQVLWTFDVTNTGNVPLTAVIVLEDGTTISCVLGAVPGTLDPGESDTCEYSAQASAGETTPAFEAMGTGPSGVVADQTADPVSYFGTLDCGDGQQEGEPGLADTPLVGFVLGPDNGLKDPPECSAPVDITSSNDGTEQVVSVGPPEGYDWGGVTGIVTIEWDAETPAALGVPRTRQRIGSTDTIIPWCLDLVTVSLYDDPGDVPDLGDLWYYGLDPSNALYPTATGGGALGVGGGDTCLISQLTLTVDVGDVIHTQTIEIYYVWNDPIWVR